jgi:hypothetical protein
MTMDDPSSRVTSIWRGAMVCVLDLTIVFSFFCA